MLAALSNLLVMLARVALLAGLALVLLGPSRAASAGAELSGLEVAAVREANHSLAIHIDGLVARVEARQVVVNQGDRDSEVLYAFDLPVEAAVTAAEIALPDGRRARSAAVDERAAFRFVPDDPGVSGAPDLGLLRRVAADRAGVARYELRIYPVAAGRSATAIVRWVAPLSYRDGRLGLRVPDRGGAANLVREQIELVWRAPAGARGLRDLRAGAQRLAGGSAMRFSGAIGEDLALEATPVFAGDQGLIAELATVPLDRDRGAFALSLLSPDRAPGAPPAFERVLLVVDRSRSLGASGLAATRALADAMLSSANRNAAADVVLFDRTARAIGGKLSTDLAGLRAALARSLTGPGQSGSDLGAALAQVAGILRRQGPVADAPVGEIARGVAPSTLIVIVTDGVLPLELDGGAARGQLGTLALAEARVASVVLVPDDGALPDLDQGPLAELARSTGGRVLAVRHGEAKARAARLWSEVTQPAPFAGVELDWPGALATSEPPMRLESGEGLLLVGWYHGQRSAAVSVRAELRGRAIAVRPRPAGDAIARAALPLALVHRLPIELLPPAALDRPDSEERARVEHVKAAHRAGVATDSTALVLIDSKDGFARDRLAHASKWGTGQFRRFPPPAERRLGEVQKPPSAPKPARARATPTARRTGELDRTLVERLMKQHVVPRARHCYEQALRRQPGLAGTVVIELEMARGEVQHAEVAQSSAASPALSACLVDAAYATPVPKVALGETGETVVVARYPLHFRSRDRRIDVSPAPDRPGTRPVDPDDPLGGL
jgi:hypothetical protein